jgi:hypothetical protein
MRSACAAARHSLRGAIRRFSKGARDINSVPVEKARDKQQRLSSVGDRLRGERGGCGDTFQTHILWSNEARQNRHQSGMSKLKALKRLSCGGTPMKYACLIYGDGNLVDPLPPEEMEKLEAEGLAFDQELRRSGHFITAQALEHANAATTIRRRNGEFSMTDGPFAETKEQLGGFFLIEARDLNEAIRIASAHPCTHWDAIEIRPVRELYPGS